MKVSNDKPTKTSILFPKIEKDLRKLPLTAFGNLSGLFVVDVYVRKEKREEWYNCCIKQTGTFTFLETLIPRCLLKSQKCQIIQE